MKQSVKDWLDEPRPWWTLVLSILIGGCVGVVLGVLIF